MLSPCVAHLRAALGHDRRSGGLTSGRKNRDSLASQVLGQKHEQKIFIDQKGPCSPEPCFLRLGLCGAHS